MSVSVDTEWLVNLKDIVHMETICEKDKVTIYKASWRKHQIVCVKEIKVDDDNYSLVDRELEILSKCIHPKVCQYLGAVYSLEKKCVLILFEYMERGNLQDYISGGALCHDEKHNILRSILVGMNYLSSRTPNKIIHRDFKPSNILVDKHGDVKIADFGVSKELYNNRMKKSSSLHIFTTTYSSESDDISHTGIGTLRWSAPEVILEESVYDHRCDIYSFGLIAFYVITDGAVPYYEEYKNNLAQIAYDKDKNTRPFLNHSRLKAFPKMLELVKICTEKDPSLRFSDANCILEQYF